MTKILYLEDEHHLGRIVQESLHSRDYDIRLVSDGIDVIETFTNFCPDICVLDVMVPNVDGFTIGKKIRELSKDTPIIFLTAKAHTDDVLEGFKSGGNDYMKKPFSMEELIVRIENLLTLNQKTHHHLTGMSIKIGAYEFSYADFQLRYLNKEISLSHRENELIKLLCDNINGKIERREILKKIWGDDSLYNSRTLDVYIRKIRQYFSEDKNVKLITLRGIGYHFSVKT